MFWLILLRLNLKISENKFNINSYIKNNNGIKWIFL